MISDARADLFYSTMAMYQAQQRKENPNFKGKDLDTAYKEMQTGYAQNNGSGEE